MSVQHYCTVEIPGLINWESIESPETIAQSYPRELCSTEKAIWAWGQAKAVHIAEFQTHRKGKTKSWADFAENLRRLANRACSELQEDAKEYNWNAQQGYSEIEH